MSERRRKEGWRRIVWRLFHDRLAVISFLFLLGVIAISCMAPILNLPDPNAIDLSKRLYPPGTPGHLLGTDEFGRDYLSRLIWGGRVSISVGFLAVLMAMSAGVLVGIFSGFMRGWWDLVIMRLIDVLMAFPYVLLAIAIIAALGPGLMNTMIALAIAGIPYYARIVRGSVLALMGKEFIQAAQALGASSLRILFRHVLPNVISPVIVAATLDVGWMIMAGAGMSFLGLGAQPPTAEWGLMLSHGSKYLRTAPHLSLFAGLAISLVVLALNFVGDGLRDALDPKVQRY
ncbi:MAG: ABC transporter permease [Candidatus Bipolaricaulota bacterium]|nr:ABC transporter permease [Candidatus Bipolaricaulota bacterium]MDW8126792.1 ABC transporter permease [Candidatus Bipolaricaulota bacterium]